MSAFGAEDYPVDIVGMDVDDPMEIDLQDKLEAKKPQKRKPSPAGTELAKRARKKPASPPVSPKKAPALQHTNNQAPRQQPRLKAQPVSGHGKSTFSPTAEHAEEQSESEQTFNPSGAEQTRMPASVMAPSDTKPVRKGPGQSSLSAVTQPQQPPRAQVSDIKLLSQSGPNKQPTGRAGTSKVKTRALFFLSQPAAIRRAVVWLCFLVLALDCQNVWRHTLPLEQVISCGRLMFDEAQLGFMEANSEGIFQPWEGSKTSLVQRIQAKKVIMDWRRTHDQEWGKAFGANKGLASIFKDHAEQYLAVAYLSPVLLVAYPDAGFGALMHMYYLQSLHGCPTPLSHRLTVWVYLVIKGIELAYLLCTGSGSSLIGLACSIAAGASKGWYQALLGGLLFKYALARADKIPDASRLILQITWAIVTMLDFIGKAREEGASRRGAR